MIFVRSCSRLDSGAVWPSVWGSVSLGHAARTAHVKRQGTLRCRYKSQVRDGLPWLILICSGRPGTIDESRKSLANPSSMRTVMIGDKVLKRQACARLFRLDCRGSQ